MSDILRLNLGCGQNPLENYVNVDKFGNPDVVCDLETFPWPWQNNSVDEVVLNHVLEHIGETTQVFLNFMKELYRICKPGAEIQINVPHPRHDNFINDPTHIRIITPEVLKHFSKSINEQWKSEQAAGTPLALYLDVNFEIIDVKYVICEPWQTSYSLGEITLDELQTCLARYNNVAMTIRMRLKAIK